MLTDSVCCHDDWVMSLRPADIPASVVAELNAGTRETANLAEGLAVDMRVLAENVAPDWFGHINWPMKPSIVKNMHACGAALAAAGDREIDALAKSPSDTVRGWVCFAIGNLDDLSLAKQLARIEWAANDHHFGVREWAWLAIRPRLAEDIEQAIARLTKWSTRKEPNLRRFASESTRPRGVWCKHIAELKERPEIALPLLEPLKSDPSKYVQDSVSNWLNDAGKTQPNWVRSVCEQWTTESETPETTRIVKRAIRNL